MGPKYIPAQQRQGQYEKVNPYFYKTKHVPLSADRFNGMIYEYGVRVIHEKVSLCPNLIGNVESNNHPIDCPLCENSFVHFDAQEIFMLYEQNSLVNSFFSYGYWEKGMASVSFPSHLENDRNHEIYVDYFDRITVLDFKERFYEVVNKSEGDKDILRYKALEVNYLSTKDRQYMYRKDFDLDIDGNIVWLGANRPKYDIITKIGEVFTVSYMRLPVYRIVELLHEGRYSQKAFKEPVRTGVKMPQQAIVKKDFLITKDEANQANKWGQGRGGLGAPSPGCEK